MFTFDTVILLSSPAEYAALTAALRGYNPQLAVETVETPEELSALDVSLLPRARMVAFATPVIVPSDILHALGYGGYNFHPGPPRYPGWAPAHFALYEQAGEFGGTLHVMAERIDSGPIVDTALFPVPSGIGVADLEGLAYAHLIHLFWKHAGMLATRREPLPVTPVKWGDQKYSRRAYQAVCDIPLDITRDELEHRMRIFGDNQWGMSPSINLHGVTFRAVV